MGVKQARVNRKGHAQRAKLEAAAHRIDLISSYCVSIKQLFLIETANERE
ncbi:MAG: hypothetical protein RQ729_02345 [Wenzhouxiangellaceae bacterium]|nr:hypothetical protein [Wenzhouxiangellaceae bacterium]